MYQHSIEHRDIRALTPYVSHERIMRTETAIARLAAKLDGRRLIVVTGDDRRKGGVYEIIRSILPFFQGSTIEVIWVDLETDPEVRPTLEFFHVLAHGHEPSNEWSVELELHKNTLDRFSSVGADQIARILRPGDVLFAHDTQTAATAGELASRGWPVVWHAHIGDTSRTELDSAYWEVFADLLSKVSKAIFYIEEYAPSLLKGISSFSVPGIDPSSTKNQIIPTTLAREKLLETSNQHRVIDELAGDLSSIQSRSVIATQISRWDPLKDMGGVAKSLLTALQENPSLHGIIAGTSAHSANERRQLQECLRIAATANDNVRRRLHVLTVSESGSELHDETIRLLQSASDIIIQKSLREGFGLTVAEAMLKSKAVIASRIGGIPAQLTSGLNGILLDDPSDTEQCAQAVISLASDPYLRKALGTAARETALRSLTIDLQLQRLADALATVAERS